MRDAIIYTSKYIKLKDISVGCCIALGIKIKNNLNTIFSLRYF